MRDGRAGCPREEELEEEEEGFDDFQVYPSRRRCGIGLSPPYGGAARNLI